MVAKPEESVIGRHLIVAHQTAASPELIQRARNLEAQDARCATCCAHLGRGRGPRDRAAAGQRTTAKLLAAGVLLATPGSCSRDSRTASPEWLRETCPASCVAATGCLSSR
jgi:hypothetical protein